MAGTEEAKVKLPTLRDVLRHLVHHAPDLSPEMRDQYRAAIDDHYSEPEPEALPAPEAPEHPDDGQLPPPPG